MRDGDDILESIASEVLVERIRAGQKTAECELVRRFSRSLMTMLERRTGDTQRAEDLHQDTFCVVLERLRSRGINDPKRLSSFLHNTAINLLIGDLRKEARRKTHADTDLIQRHKDTKSDQIRLLMRSEANTAIRQLIQELGNSRDRELLYRFYILQQEKPIICKTLTLTPKHFDRVISRARSRFRHLVENDQFVLESIDAP